ncbi:hypothetical protein EAO69_13450, partial [Streptomyces sp. me109]
ETGGEEQVPGLAAAGAVMPFLSYLTLLTVALVPLAAALYVVTSTTWSAVERTAPPRPRRTALHGAVRRAPLRGTAPPAPPRSTSYWSPRTARRPAAPTPR